MSDWIAESISSSSVIGRFSWIATAMGEGEAGLLDLRLLRRSDVIVPGPFLLRDVFPVEEAIRRTLDGEAVRAGAMGGVCIRSGGVEGTGFRRSCCACCCGETFRRRSPSCLRNESTWGVEPRRLRQWRSMSSGESERE